MDPRHWVKVGVRMGEAQLSPLYTSGSFRGNQREVWEGHRGFRKTDSCLHATWKGLWDPVRVTRAII